MVTPWLPCPEKIMVSKTNASNIYIPLIVGSGLKSLCGCGLTSNRILGFRISTTYIDLMQMLVNKSAHFDVNFLCIEFHEMSTMCMDNDWHLHNHL